MAVNPNPDQREDRAAEAQLFDQYGSFVADPEAKRVELLAKLVYLLENVAEQDKTALIKSKIISQRRYFERFDLARSWDEGDAYFKKFLATLDVAQLAALLEIIKLPLTQNQITQPKTAAAFKFVFHGVVPPTPKLMIEESIDSAGNYWAATLEESAERAYREANLKYPSRNLEKRELNKCGKPCAEIFSTYLSMLGDDQTRLKFNKFIRDRITNEALSDYQLQQRLLYAADRLADVLEQRQKYVQADNIRSALNQAGYPSKPLHENKTVRRAPLVLMLLDSARKLKHDVRSMLGSRTKPKIAPGNQPNYYQAQPQLGDPYQSSDALQQLQDLYARFAKVQQDIENAKGYEVAKAEPQPKDLTFAFKPAKSMPYIGTHDADASQSVIRTFVNPVVK